MRIARIFLSFPLLVAAGCNPLTATDSVDLRFSSAIVTDPTQDSLIGVTASGGAGVIVIAGTVPTQSACYVLTPDVERSGNRIVATIAARESQSGCPAGSVLYSYTLRIGRLAAGEYHLTIVHDVRGAATTAVWTPLDANLTVR